MEIVLNKTSFLDVPIQVEPMHGVTFSNENKGHKFVVSCMRGGELLTLTGTVTARFMRANNTTILIAGNDYTGIVDGKAVVTLPQDCYNVPGRFQMAIFLTANGSTSCIYACVGSVQRTQNGDLIDSGEAVPSLEELLAQIDACEQATADATAAANAVPGLVAETFATNKAYMAGSYVYYNGSLYRFTADHAAGAWTGSDATAVKFGDDVSDLKSAKNCDYRFARTIYNNIRTYTLTSQDVVSGSYNATGHKISSSTRLFYELPITSRAFDYFEFTPGIKVTDISYAFYDKETGSQRYDSDWQTGNQLVHVSADCRIIFAFRKTGNASILPSDFDATLTYHSDITTQSAEINYTAKSSLNYGNYTIVPTDLENGSYNSQGSLIANNYRLRTRYKIPASCGDIISFTPATNITGIAIAYYNTSGAYVSNIEFYSATTTYVPVDGFCLIVLKPPMDVTLYPDKNDATVSIIPSTHHDVKINLEKGAYDSSHIEDIRYSTVLSDYSNYLINKYPILVGGADVFKIIGFPSSYTSNVVARFYDENGDPVAKRNVVLDTLFGVPSGSYYIDFECPTFDFKSHDIYVRFFNGDGKQKEVKRIYTYDGNTIIQLMDVNANIITGMSYKLPPNYSNTGDKVGLILWFAGNMNYPDIASGFARTYEPGIEYMRDEGYAVLQVFSWGSYYYNQYSDCGRDQPYPLPTCIECIKKGIEYMTDRYNIDADNVHIMSHSVGGIMALFLASEPIYDFKSIGMFAPCTDFLSMRGRYPSTRRILAEELQLNGDLEDFFDITFSGETQTGVENWYFSPRCVPFWEQNMPALIRLNPAWKNLIGATATTKFNAAISDAQTWWADKTATTVYDDNTYEKLSVVPLKAWMSNSDPETPYLVVEEVINQLQNGGSTAELKTFVSSSHSVYNLDKENITTALGISHTDIGAAWRENIAWIRENTMK